jgi:hypothetical protein
MSSVTLKAGAKLELLFNKRASADYSIKNDRAVATWKPWVPLKYGSVFSGFVKIELSLVP